jgi:hypothetical protein
MRSKDWRRNRVTSEILSSAGKPLVLQSLPQALGLVAPSLIAFLAPERKTKHDKRGDREERNNSSHLRPPMRLWAIEDNAGFLISCLRVG